MIETDINQLLLIEKPTFCFKSVSFTFDLVGFVRTKSSSNVEDRTLLKFIFRKTILVQIKSTISNEVKFNIHKNELYNTNVTI